MNDNSRLDMVSKWIIRYVASGNTCEKVIDVAELGSFSFFCKQIKGMPNADRKIMIIVGDTYTTVFVNHADLDDVSEKITVPALRALVGLAIAQRSQEIEMWASRYLT